MAGSARRFAKLLSDGVHRIRSRESKSVQIVQDELGYALGRAGGSAIKHWRKGHLPPSHRDIAQLATELVRRGGFDQQWLEQFLESAGYADPAQLYAVCFPSNTAALHVSPVQHTPQSSAAAATQHLAPFIVGPPVLAPHQFFGRAAELQAIFDLWRHHPLQNVALIGVRRSGKTSLLHYLATITTTPADELRPDQRGDWLPDPERYRWVFVDFQDARACRRDWLLRYLLTQLLLPAPETCELETFLDIVSQQLRTPAIILMDEIGAGLAAPELDQRFWWSLRSLGTLQTRGQLGFVLAAHEAPTQLAQEHGKPSPFFNIFGHTFRLGPLDEAAARALIASSPLPFEPEDTEWILTQSGCWPYHLQSLCHLRLTALRRDDAPSVWRAQGLRQLAALRPGEPKP